MTEERRVISFLKAHEAEMFALLEKMVLIQSSSYNKEGVDQVARTGANLVIKRRNFIEIYYPQLS